MATTRYFEEQALRKRTYIRREWCEQALRSPERIELASQNRVRYWIYIPELGAHLRVVTLEDGKTLHDAYPDKAYKEEAS
ncbi:MAG: hypothetical protein GC160_04675 [Acidobacteria bacterium]|nr:hypothetical protein [Acidobacteriota bacterium]